MRNQILEILNDVNDEIDYENEDALIDDGLLDSFDIVALVGSLKEEFGIKINVTDLIPSNFNSVDAIEQLVKRLVDGR